MSKKRLFPLIAVGLLAMILVVTTGCSKDTKATDETVATIGDEKITKDELYDVLVQASGQEALASMIEKKVIELELKKEKVTVSDKEVETELAKYIESGGGKEAFTATLEQNGMTEKQFKESIVEFLSIQKVLKPGKEITDEEIKAYFEENKESFQQEGKAEPVLAEHKEAIKQQLTDENLQTQYVEWLEKAQSNYKINNTLLAK
jgi:foldase protein PrsA